MSDFYEIVLEGDEEVLRGFVAGYLAAADLDRRIFVSEDFKIQHESLAYQLGEWIGLVKDRTYLIVPEAAHERIRIGATRLGDKLKIAFGSSRKIEEARFDFSWKTFNREEADGLRAHFAQPPDGVTLDGYKPEEKVHADERGETGAYAPTHPYTAMAEGVAHGRPGAVIEWAAELRLMEFVKLETIKLSYTD